MLGERLREAREKRMLSQERVASTLNVSRQAISKWENDKAEPDLQSLKRLCDLYGMTLDEIVSFHTENSEENKENCSQPETSIFDSEIFVLAIIALVICSCSIAFVGVAVSLSFLILSRKIKKKYWRWTIFFICLVALGLNLYSCKEIVEMIFDSGYGTVEYLGYIF